jgi:alkaline phosphatase D
MPDRPMTSKPVSFRALRRALLRAGSLWPLAGMGTRAHGGVQGEAQQVQPDGAEDLKLPSLQAESGVWRIGFGSCARQSLPQPIWQAITAARPHLFAFLGDNFYGDATTPEALRARHAEFQQASALQAFRRSHPHVAIWDDHDYGVDDAGGEYPHKLLSQRLFCDTWGEAPTSPRRSRSGVYQAYRIRAQGKTVQLILPDLRFNRTALKIDPSKRTGYERMILAAKLGSREPVPGWYVPNADPAATMLGEPQWQWLEAQLAQPADLRILCSSVQLAADGTGWECWANFSADRERLLQTLRRHRTEHLLVISGDMHYGELSRLDAPGLYPIWDLTSSGLTEVWKVPTPNSRRHAGVLAEVNFGMLEVDWASGMVSLSVRDVEGQARIHHRLALESLRLS